MEKTRYPGRPYPLGATWDGEGVNFALYAEHATKVKLCLFDSAMGQSEARRIAGWKRNDGISLDGRFCQKPRRIFEWQSAPECRTPRGTDRGSKLLCRFNAHHGHVDYSLPCGRYGHRWVKTLDTSTDGPGNGHYASEAIVPVNGRSIVVFALADEGIGNADRPREYAAEYAGLSEAEHKKSQKKLNAEP